MNLLEQHIDYYVFTLISTKGLFYRKSKWYSVNVYMEFIMNLNSKLKEVRKMNINFNLAADIHKLMFVYLLKIFSRF